MKGKKKRSQRPGDLYRKEGAYNKRRLPINKATFVPWLIRNGTLQKHWYN
jgi:hypothetical protein